MSDHVQKVLKPNWSASWEEIGAENELEDTYTLPIPTLEGSIEFFSSVLSNRYDIYCRVREENHLLYGNATLRKI